MGSSRGVWSFSLELGVEFFGEGFAGSCVNGVGAPLGRSSRGSVPKRSKNCGSIFFTSSTISLTTARDSLGVSEAALHAPEAVKDDAGDGVNHRGESGDRNNVARDFDGPFFCCALDFLDVLGAGIRADVPDVRELAQASAIRSEKLTVKNPRL